MSAHERFGQAKGGRGTGIMKTGPGVRAALIAVTAGALLVMVGDSRGVAVASRGIDPLEVLNLSIKPNVIVVLDSSGSMQETVGGTDMASGDHPRSKLFQAKTVLNEVIQENASRVSFMFGQYTQNVYDPNGTPPNATGSKLQGTGAGATRFRYSANSFVSPSMATTELTMNRQPPPSVSVNITPANDQIQFFERVDTNSSRRTFAVCTITLTDGAYTGDTQLAALAADITAKMQLAAYSPACTYTGTSTNTVQNSYTVTWDATNRRFTITRSAGSNGFQVRFATATNSAGPTLGFTTNIPNVTQPIPGTTGNSTNFGSTFWRTVSTAFNGTALGVVGAASKGFQAFQKIVTGLNTLYFKEGSTNCAVLITPGFYSTGEFLATEMQTRMNACGGRGSTPNTYSVTYNSGSGQFTFTRTGSNTATLQWSNGTSSIRGPLNAGTADASFSFTTGNSIGLLRRSTSDEVTESFDYNGDGTVDTVTTYNLLAGKFYNGETFFVQSDGTLCGMSSTVTTTNPPSVNLQQVTTCGGSTVGSPVNFVFSGGSFSGNTIACNGFSSKVPLVPCDQSSGQLTLITPFLQRELPFNADGTLRDYREVSDGTFALDTSGGAPVPGPSGGIKADGLTPIANSLRDIKTYFTNLWNNGQTTPFLDAIKVHVDPKEHTIVLFVTDGDDTCAPGTGDQEALAAALRAQQLYAPVDSAQPASSVSTYMVGFGSGASVNRLNWIAWGGSGLGQNQAGQPAVGNDGTKWTDSSTTLATKRAQCTTCQDAFVAPDAATLGAVLRALIEQGASIGEFTAQQSIVDSVFEYVSEVVVGTQTFNSNDPTTRYEAVVPVRFRSSFSLPGFKGEVKAITNEGGSPFTRWTAGQLLHDTVLNGPGNAGTGTGSCADGAAGQCVFSSLTTKVKRNIYTTSRNGVFPATIANYFDTTWLRTNGNRTVLWPPPSGVDPTAGTLGSLDVAMGLTTTAIAGSPTAANVTALQDEFGACLGSSAPAACAGTVAQQFNQSLKEAREMVLAYTAGAEVVLDAAAEPTRVASGSNAGQILYQARAWILADSTLGDPAVVAPPVFASPDNGGFGTEYQLMRDGPRNTSTNVASNGIDVGLGLRSPDADALNSGVDTRTTLKPVMTVLYVPANDMLHAFRAGPSQATSGAPPNCTVSASADCGGEEIWGFVPFDQLGKLRERMQPQSRNNHTYMLAAPVRFADVFVPNAGTDGNFDGATTTHTVGGVTTPAMKGVWRRILLFGRGIGGKYLTALDITAPGTYTRSTKDTSNTIIGPVVLWNRGNPDTQDGTAGGLDDNNAGDTTAYSHMGETWSTPAISFVDKLPTTRKPCAATSTAGVACVDQSGGGVSFVAFVGSGYGDTGEGTTFYTLDVLTGDVVASADVGSRVPVPFGGYANAIVASPAVYIPTELVAGKAPHPSDAKAGRVYVGDLHGRLWKFLAAQPGTAIEFADLGTDQPVGTPAALLRLPADQTGKPFIYVETGNESRADPNHEKFRLFAFRDDQADNDTASPSVLQSCTPTVQLPCLFTKQFPNIFRGTIQPATIYGDPRGTLGRTFFGGVRFVPPPPESTLSTAVPPYPCRSRFDSVIFALGAETGQAAYDLNAGTMDDYVGRENSRIVALSLQSDTTAGSKGSQLQIDEGLANSSTPNSDAPPPKGKRPAIPGSTGVVMSSFRPSSIVCR